MFPSEISKKITLDETENGVVKSTYTFSYNPVQVSIKSALFNVKSDFLRNDRSVVRPTQLDSRVVTGAGRFLDSYNENLSAFDSYKDIESFQAKKIPLLFTHEKYGNFFIIIQELSIRNTGTYNAVDFDFNFIETRIANTATGFERDNNTDGIANLEEEQNATSFTEYTVVSGDSLWKIALNFYGNGSLWPKIYEYNKNTIGGNPNLILPGQVLNIPDSSASSGVAGGGTPQTGYTPPPSEENNIDNKNGFSTFEELSGEDVQDFYSDAWRAIYGSESAKTIKKTVNGILLAPLYPVTD